MDNTTQIMKCANKMAEIISYFEEKVGKDDTQKLYTLISAAITRERLTMVNNIVKNTVFIE